MHRRGRNVMGGRTLRAAATAAIAAFAVACGGTSETDEASAGGAAGAAGSSGTGGSSGAAGSSGTGGSSGAAGSGTGGAAGSSTGGSGGIDCSNVGCAQAPLCSEGCSAPCGCCGCPDGERINRGGVPHVCVGGCYEPAAADPCACPEDPPADGAPCDASCAGRSCGYERCADEGLVEARCEQDRFLVTTSACGTLPCGDFGAVMACAEGTVCIQQFGGALFPPECRSHDCGTGPLGCECVATSCPGECSRTGPFAFSCNTCPSGLCP